MGKKKTAPKRHNPVADEFRSLAMVLINEYKFTRPSISKAIGMSNDKLIGILKKNNATGNYDSNLVSEDELAELKSKFGYILGETIDDVIEQKERELKQNEEIVELLQDILRGQKELDVDLGRMIKVEINRVMDEKIKEIVPEIIYQIKKQISEEE